MMKKIAPLFLLLAFVAIVAAQDATSTAATAQQSPDPQQQQEEKAKLEKKAIALLEQVVTDSQGLRLPENKIRVQIAAGDMLWEKNPARARVPGSFPRACRRRQSAPGFCFPAISNPGYR